MEVPPMEQPQTANALTVSIIINNYNYDRFLAQAIDSALNQTYDNIEVIVVDDGSTDASRQLIAGYGEAIKPVLQPNSKQGIAFNNGFNHSTGDIIIFLDADDYLEPQAAATIVAAWQPGLAKIHYRLRVVDAQSQPSGVSYPQANQLSQGDLTQIVINFGSYAGVPTSGNALSRTAMTHVLPIPDAFKTTADDYLSVLMPLYGQVEAIEEPLGNYRIHTNNQWALATFSCDRFRRFIRHDMQRCELLKYRAAALGYTVPPDLEYRFFGRVWSRLASLKLEPEHHPVATDRAIVLSYWGIRAILKYSGFNSSKKLLYSLWFVWVGMMPRPLAKPAIVWLLAPQFRPKPIQRVLTRFRTAIS
ncbi:MAG: glycosyltransferase family 2 protein [Leptolyngbyaceae cyanobacterium]